MDGCPEIDRLYGTRAALVSAEVRLPLFGTEQFGLINFPYLPTELALFADAGLAWTAEQSPVGRCDRDTWGRVPVTRLGASGRGDLLGAVVCELYYAYRFPRPGPGAGLGP